MTVDILRSRMNDYVSAKRKRLLQIRSSECVVTDDLYLRIEFVSDLRCLADIYDLLAAVNEVQMVAVIAPIPDEVAIAASPPSSFATFCSTEMQVGFPILV